MNKYEKIVNLVCEWFGNHSVMTAEDWDTILIEVDRRGNVPIWNEEGLSNEGLSNEEESDE